MLRKVAEERGQPDPVQRIVDDPVEVRLFVAFGAAWAPRVHARARGGRVLLGPLLGGHDPRPQHLKAS
eukprot:CAMPEP_0179104250 /NCGR_PEP_ID=MMETSP0796-20121207/48348_1 /TAXON_ID=73915 /ORGANISM="Pyrodinium bahamense, Strain pbaha01" /LENGTH=67 /DNA_ID=CAMNT_0020802185 /DNA_START=533 /DNA_END=736 /DNA_ORIENTATION=+